MRRCSEKVLGKPAMEILRNKVSTYPFKTERVYETWMSKTTGRSKKLMKKKYLIQLEYVLFLLSLGNISEAYDTIKFVLPAGGFYMKDHANLSVDNVMLSKLGKIDGFLPFPLGWNINLFRIQLAPSTNIIYACHQLSQGINKEHYLNAVNYLRVATYSSQPLLPALVPFVQLLWLGGQFKETLIELKNFCYSSNAVLPNSVVGDVMLLLFFALDQDGGTGLGTRKSVMLLLFFDWSGP